MNLHKSHTNLDKTHKNLKKENKNGPAPMKSQPILNISHTNLTKSHTNLKKSQKWGKPDRKSKLKLEQDFLWIMLDSSGFMMGFLKAFSFSKRPLTVMVLIPP